MKAEKLNQCTHTISVVDDSDLIRRTFKVMLEHAGYCVTEFASGKEFLNSGLEEPTDCILLDLEMPGPNGIEVLDAMQDLSCKMPVVLVVTGTNNTALLADADRDFVTAILKKPVGPDELLAAVAGALD
jgi:two-component system response regulator FixJ